MRLARQGRMIASRAIASGALALLVCGFSGCTRSNERGSSIDQVPSSAEGNLKGAVTEIVTERCIREERCKNIGADRPYESRDACTSKLKGSTESDINVKGCKHG